MKKAKKGSKAYRAKLSVAQKRSWAKRRESATAKDWRESIERGEKVTDAKYSHTNKAMPFAVADEVVAESLDDTVTLGSLVRADRERDVEEVRAWINAASTQEERQKRKAAMHSVMYGGEQAPFNPDLMFKLPPIHPDPVNSPPHYLRHPSGVECITITEHFNFNRGNAIKYIWRADEKGSMLENLRKARWYLDREISRLEKEAVR